MCQSELTHEHKEACLINKFTIRQFKAELLTCPTIFSAPWMMINKSESHAAMAPRMTGTKCGQSQLFLIQVNLGDSFRLIEENMDARFAGGVSFCSFEFDSLILDSLK